MCSGLRPRPSLRRVSPFCLPPHSPAGVGERPVFGWRRRGGERAGHTVSPHAPTAAAWSSLEQRASGRARRTILAELVGGSGRRGSSSCSAFVADPACVRTHAEIFMGRLVRSRRARARGPVYSSKTQSQALWKGMWDSLTPSRQAKARLPGDGHGRRHHPLIGSFLAFALRRQCPTTLVCGSTDWPHAH